MIVIRVGKCQFSIYLKKQTSQEYLMAKLQRLRMLLFNIANNYPVPPIH